MNNKNLTIDEVINLVKTNSYEVTEKNKLLSRCIDGRYENSDNLAPIGFPGGDIGVLVVIIAAANNFGFEIDLQKAYQSLIEVIGGKKNFGLHTDSHADLKKIASGCGHFKQINLDSKAYNLTKEQVDFIYKKIAEVKKSGAKEIILHGDHLEGAVLLVYGDSKSVMNQFTVKGKTIQVFVFHQTLANLRNKLLATKLVENKAVKLSSGLDEDYLYTALSEVTEVHLMETAKRLAKGLPIYKAAFEDDGQTEIKEMGVV